MKNFTYKTALVSLLFITIMTLFITYGKMIYNSPEYPMWKSKMDYISTNTNNHNIIIGDSRALVSFSPKQLDDNYYNLAVGGGTPIEGLPKKHLKNSFYPSLLVIWNVLKYFMIEL